MNNRHSRLNLGSGGGHGDDLMITPLLDLMVALIPFLIFSAVMTKINIVDVGISKPVATTTSSSKDNFELVLKIADNSAEILLNGKTYQTLTKPSGSKAEALWVSSVHEALVGIKRKSPDQFKIRIEPKGKVTLQTIMSFMDGARRLNEKDGEITGKDASGKNIKLQFLFPNVILRGVYG